MNRYAERMNADQFPLNQPIVITSTADFSVTVTRVDSDWMETVWSDQRTGDATLKVRHRVDGASSFLMHIDVVWWRVNVNGRPATQGDMDDLLRKLMLQFSVNPTARELSITV